MHAYSYDGGDSWTPAREGSRQLPEPVRGCEGSVVYHPGAKKLFFSHPDPYMAELEIFRQRMTVWSSENMGATWEKHAVVWPSAAGYSTLTVANETHLGILYARNNHTLIIFEAQSVSYTTLRVV